MAEFAFLLNDANGYFFSDGISSEKMARNSLLYNSAFI